MGRMLTMKKAFGLLAVLLALIMVLNIVTPALPEAIMEAFSAATHDYTLKIGDKAATKGSESKEVAYDNGNILIYNYSQLSMIGSGKTHTYDDGVTVEYKSNASYKLANDIPLPRHTRWQLPKGFKGKIVGEEQKDASLYDEQKDSVYLYHPYQLAVMAMDDADRQPVMSGDADEKTFGSGKVICTDEEGKSYLTYNDDQNYVVSASFTSEISEKPVSVVSQDKDEPQPASNTSKAARTVKTAKVGKAPVGATSDGRDFSGQVIKKIDGKTYILIGNADQLRAIGTDAKVWARAYSNNKMIYGGDADLKSSENGSGNFTFHQLNADLLSDWPRAGVNQDTGQVYTDSAHVDDSALGTAHSWETSEKYTTNANYIIFRDIDLGGSSDPWTPLMFTGNMYGIKSANGSALWNGSAIGDATAMSARTTANRPVISNVYVNNSSPIEVNKYIGIGFFATVTNEVNLADIEVSSGTVHVENIELSGAEVRNTATTAKSTQTIVSGLTTSLGWLVGGLVDLLGTALSFGSMNLSLNNTLSSLLNARAEDPTIYATGAFAGRVVGDVEITNCAVTDSVTVQNAKDRTGGFIGYSEGTTQYDGLSTTLGVTTEALASLLNVIPGLGLGDLVTILLDNALPVGDLIVTGYIAPKVNNCEVNGLTGDVGTTTTMMAGGFIGQQIGTRISNSHVTDSSYHIKAHNYGGGFSGLERDAEIRGTLDGLGIDLATATSAQLAEWTTNMSATIEAIHPQSVLVDCTIDDSAYQVSGTDCLGGFVGAMTSSYAVDCTIDCDQEQITIHGSEFIGGFAGFSSVGWQSNLGKDENKDASLLGTVKELAIGLLDSEDKSAGQNLLTLMGVSPSAILGCQVYSSSLEVEADKSFAGGMVGKGEGIYLCKSNQAAYDDIADWNSGTLKETPSNRPIVLSGLKSVRTHEHFAGGVGGYMASAAFSGLLNDVVGLGDFIGFTVGNVTVTGITGGYTVKADGYDAGGDFGLTVGGTITNVKLNELKQVDAENCAAGFTGIAGPGDMAGTHGLTVNLLGLDRVLEVSNLLNIGQGIEVHITDCDVNGIESGYTVSATGRNEGYDVDEFTAAGFIADSNSTKITDSHCYNLSSVTAANDYGFAGGFVGTSETGGLAEAANNDATSVKKLIQAEGLLRAIQYLIPEYTNCTTNFVDGGYVDADVAGGFAANFASGTVDNSTIATVDDAQNPKWTHSMKELYDPNAVNATGDLNKQFAVINIDYVHGRTYAGGFGGKLISGALASAGGGLSILGNNDLGLSLDVTNLASIINTYIPYVKHAGVYSTNGFTVAANTVRTDEPNSGSAGGFGGYMSGAQISNCDVYKLKNTTVTPPSDLEAVSAPSYYDSSQSTYAVTGGHYAGGYAGKIDIGSAASLGNGLKILGNSIDLADAVSALSIVVSTIEHSDVQGAGGGFSVIANATDTNEGKVGKAGGFAGGLYGGHIQNSHCKNFYYIIGEVAAGGYVGNMVPGDVSKLLDEASIFDRLINVDSSLISLAEDFVPTIRNSTTSCVPCGGAVRAQSASDSEFQRGCAGGYCGYNDGGHIWGLNTNTWERQKDGVVGSRNFGHNTEGNYTGEQHIATAWRIRSVYGAEFAGGYTGFMKSADTVGTSGVSLLGGLISVNNVLSALSVVYPTEEHTAVYGPLRNLDVDTWNAWVTYVGKYGGYGAELASTGTVSTQAQLNTKLSKYIYGCNVVAGRSTYESTMITQGGCAGGYVGYMFSGVITDGQSYDMKKIRGMKSAGGYAGKMQTGGAANFGSVSILGLGLNLGNLVKAVETFVPTVKSGTVHGWQSGMTVESFGTDYTHKCGYAGGYAGTAYGAQIWGDKNVGNTAGTGCNVTNLRYVKGANIAGGYVGIATAASLADVNTNSSDGLLQTLLNDLITEPGDLASVMPATITTIRKAEVDPDNNSFGFTVGGIGNSTPHFAGGFAGSLEAAVIGSHKGASDITVNGLRSVDGLYYAGGFVGLADVGGVASVFGTGDQQTSIIGLINAGSVDLLDVFRTYIYYSDVNGVSDGMVIRAYESAPEGILSETRQSGCAGGFGGGIMNGTVTHSDVTNLNSVYALNYTGGFIGHMGKNGAVDVDKAQIPLLSGLNAGAIDVFGTTVNECSVAGISAGAVVMAREGTEPISGGFAGYADDAQIKNSAVTKLKQVYSDQIAGGFVGKTNMSYVLSAEVDSATVQLVLTIVNALVKALYVPNLENINLIDIDSSLVGLKLLSDGDLLYVNLLGLRIGASLVKSTVPGETDTALITIGDSTVALPCNENGIDTTGQNAEVVVNLIKANRTRVDHCSVTGIADGYDVYGGGASNKKDGSGVNGYTGGFVGYNNEGKFTSDRMVYCDVIRGTAQKVGTFSGGTSLQSVYSFNTLESIEKVQGEENHYSVYRTTDLTYALTSDGQEIATAVSDDGTSYKRFDITHLASPIVPGENEAYYRIFEKWNGAKLASNASGADATLLKVYVSNAKADLMLDTPTYANDESLIPNPGENNDPCGNIDLTIQKVWNDNNDKDHSRPDQIRVRIWQHLDNSANGVVYKDSSVITDVDATNGWFTISKSEHGRKDSATWTRTIKGLPVYTTDGGTTHYYSYTVEEEGIIGYNSTVTYDETNSTTTAKIVNTPKPFEIEFKYYDRYEINGIPSGIKDRETVYSVTVDSIPKKFITYSEGTNNVESINFAELIGEKAVEFSENALSVTNVMCDYDLWTSQSTAASAMKSRSYFVDGESVSYDDTTYHTDYLGKPKTHKDYSGKPESANEKWVNYYDSDGDTLEESFTTANDYLKVNKIVVWCYNYPRQYNVDIYGADSTDDLNEKTVGESTVYVARAISGDNNVKHLNDHFYYNQRFGKATGVEDEGHGGFIENYGLPRYTNVLPSDYAAESIDGYDFAYWAYDQNGTQIASVDRDFWYRVTNHTKLYAVYAAPGTTTPGISISANANDTFVDESGVSRTRLNVLGSVFGAEKYDPDVQKLAFMNISLSTQIRDNPTVYTPVRINALFEQYKDQLKTIIETYDRKNGSKAFSTAYTYDGAIDENGSLSTTLNLTLTTKGYIYTVVSNGNTPASGDSTINLTNMNRVQFTTVFKTSALNINNTGTNGNSCLMNCAALKYNGNWSISTNCLIYYNGEVVRNTASAWN